MKDAAFYAGAGRAEIQFPAGYFPQEGFTGLRDEICARAVILECGVRAVIVSLELPSIRPYTLIDLLRRRISGLTGAAFEHIWVCVTHDMSAPHVPQEEEKRKLHMDAVQEAVEAAVRQAVQTMQPAALGVGTGTTRVNASRNILTKDGWWQGVNPDAYSDHRLTVVRINGRRQQAIALLYSLDVRPWVTADVTLDDGTRRITGDLAGEASRKLEARYQNAVAVFLMGAAADQVPVKKGRHYSVDEGGALYEVDHGAESYDMMAALGSELADEAASAAEAAICTEQVSPLACRQASFLWKGQQRYHLPDRDVPHPKTEYVFEPAENQEVLIQLIRLGELALVGMQPEISSSTGTQLYRRSPFRCTVLVGMVNGGQAYMPCREAYRQLLPDAMNALVAEGAAERFLDAAQELLTDSARSL